MSFNIPGLTIVDHAQVCNPYTHVLAEDDTSNSDYVEVDPLPIHNMI